MLRSRNFRALSADALCVASSMKRAIARAAVAFCGSYLVAPSRQEPIRKWRGPLSSPKARASIPAHSHTGWLWRYSRRAITVIRMAHGKVTPPRQGVAQGTFQPLVCPSSQTLSAESGRPSCFNLHDGCDLYACECIWKNPETTPLFVPAHVSVVSWWCRQNVASPRYEYCVLSNGRQSRIVIVSVTQTCSRNACGDRLRSTSYCQRAVFGRLEFQHVVCLSGWTP